MYFNLYCRNTIMTSFSIQVIRNETTTQLQINSSVLWYMYTTTFWKETAFLGGKCYVVTYIDHV